MASSVVVRAAVKRFGRREALAGVSFTAHGGVTTLLGPNGAGKSTLVRGLATVQPFDGGAVLVDGMDPANPSERTEIRRRLGYLPQSPAFNPRTRVFDALDYLAVMKGIGERRRRHVEVRWVLDEVGLADRVTDQVRSLSGGMVQRLGLAQALLGRPSLLVLDEPASGLDPRQRIDLRARISRLGERATVVVSTHLTDEAAAVSQVIHVLDRGRIVFTGPPDHLRERARGQVWSADAPPASSAVLSWRTPEGRWRCVGPAPPGAIPEEPTVEDAYLLLVGRDGLAEESPAA